MAKGIGILSVLIFLFWGSSYSQNSDLPREKFRMVLDKYSSRNIDEINYDSLQFDIQQFLSEITQSKNPEPEYWLYPYYQFAIRLYYESPNRAANFLLPLSQFDWVSPIDSVYDRLGRIFNLMGLALKNSQRPGEGANQLTQAINYFKKTELKDPLILPSLYNNVANAYQNLGDFEKAAEYCKEGNRQIMQSIIIHKDSARIVASLNNILVPIKHNWGIILGKMGYHKQAILLYIEALDIAKETNNSNLPLIYGNLGVSYQELKDFSSAKRSYSLSIEGAEERQLFDVYLNSSVNLLSLYSQTTELDEFNKLRTHLLTEISRIKQGDNKQQLIATILIQQAKIFLNTSNSEEAMLYLEQAYKKLSSLSVNLNANDFINTIQNYPDLSLELMHLSSQALIKLGLKTKSVFKINQATRQLYFAENLIDSLRSVLVSQESKLILNEQQKKIYHSKADACRYLYTLEGQQKHLHELFETIERGKSAGLWNEMQQQDLKAAYIPDSLLQKEKQLKNELAQLSNTIKKLKDTYNSNPKAINDLESNSFTLTSSLDSLYRVYNRDFPDYYHLKFGNETQSLESIQELLHQNEVFVQLFVTEQAIHELLVKKDTLLFQSLGEVDEIMDKTQQLLQAMKSRRYNYTRKEFKDFVGASDALYQSLFRPFLEEIKDCHLILSPDDLFNLFPFEVLITERPAENTYDFGDLAYFIFDHPIIYTNTATLWASHNEARETGVNPLAAVAFAPYYSVAQNDVPFSVIYGESLPELPGTLEEVDFMKKIFKGRYFVRQKATESNYKKHMGDASILHLAMHTILDNDEPLNSFLAFYPESNTEEDGRLSGTEILNQEINADLVVLSACNSGSGEVRAGEGILGLSRSFIQAGSKSLLLNLWTMDDTQGKKLMISFYTYLTEGMSVAEALQQAKIEHISSSRALLAHPHYWAGIAAQGTDLNPSLPHKDSFLWIYLLLMLPLGGLIWLIIKKLGLK